MEQLDTRTRDLLRERARVLMKRATMDMFHDSSHIERTLNLARRIYSSVDHNNDWDLIKQTVLWHDISRINNRGAGIFMFYFDDLLSVRIVRKEFSKLNVDKGFTKKVCRLILEHRHYSLNRETVSGAIFRDADTLDMYSVDRYKRALRYIKTGWMSKPGSLQQKIFRQILSFYVYLVIVMIHSKVRKQLTFDVSRRIYDRKMQVLRKFFNARRRTTGQLLTKWALKVLDAQLNRC